MWDILLFRECWLLSSPIAATYPKKRLEGGHAAMKQKKTQKLAHTHTHIHLHLNTHFIDCIYQLANTDIS